MVEAKGRRGGTTLTARVSHTIAGRTHAGSVQRK